MSFYTRPQCLAPLLAISLLSAACSRDSMPAMEQQLVGRWEWQQSSTGSADVLTPATTGHEVVVEFDRRGRAMFYQDGALQSAAAFSVRQQRPGRHVIQYRGYGGSQYYTVSGNVLYLQEMKGQTTRHSYVRLPAAQSAATASSSAL